jgi:hypothetical protein
MKKKIMRKKVVSHLKGDIKNFKKEASEDKKLLKSLKHEKKESKKHEKMEHAKGKVKHKKSAAKKGVNKFKKVMHEFKEEKLHSGSKTGKLVTNPKQAVAIAYSEDRRAHKKAKRK